MGVKLTRVLLFLMLLMMVLLNADQMVMSPNIGMIEEEFGITDRQIGYIAGSFTIIGAIISLIWGYLSDRFSRKNLLLFAVLVGEIPCFLTAFAVNFTQLFILRALSGIGMGALFPVIFSFTGDTFGEEERPKVNAMLSTAISLGAIVGMIVAGFLGGTYGWRLPFILVSVPNVFIAILFYIIVKEPERGASEVAVGELVEKGYKYTSKVRLSDYLVLFKNKTNLILFIQGILGTIPWGAIPYFLVEFLKRNRGFTASEATLIFIFFGIGNVLGIYFGGIVGGKLYKKNPKYMPLFSGISTAIGAGFALLVLNVEVQADISGFIILSLLGMVAAALASITGPNMKTMLMNVNVPENRGRIFSIFNLTDSLGTGAGKFIAGSISTVLGSLGAAMNISAMFWLPCAGVLLISVFTLQGDIKKLHVKMKEVAQKMKG